MAFIVTQVTFAYNLKSFSAEHLSYMISPMHDFCGAVLLCVFILSVSLPKPNTPSKANRPWQGWGTTCPAWSRLMKGKKLTTLNVLQ